MLAACSGENNVSGPQAEIVEFYHQRWGIETSYLELKSGILGGRVLRARTPAGIEQEVYALLITNQALRLAMADATDTDPALSPDRASFTVALHAARDQLVHGRGDHRRHRDRPGRCDRPSSTQRSTARAPHQSQSPGRETRDLQTSSQK